jgi:methylthioribose-1-phosphate isomerase
MGSRPTAVDLSNAIKLLKKTSKSAANDSLSVDQTLTCANIRLAYIEAAEKILEDDLTTNLAIGRYGAEYLRSLQKPHMAPIDETDVLRYFTTSPPGTQGLPDQAYRKLSVLTHCNTG